MSSLRSPLLCCHGNTRVGIPAGQQGAVVLYQKTKLRPTSSVRMCVWWEHQHGEHILTQSSIQYSFRNDRFTLHFSLSLSPPSFSLYLSNAPPLPSFSTSLTALFLSLSFHGTVSAHPRSSLVSLI